MNKLSAIHLIRFIASVAVVVFHFLPSKRLGHVGNVINNSNEFVNLFFFISGLVLSFSNGLALSTNTISRKQFYINRLARLYPSYLLALFAVILFSIIYNIDLGRTTYVKLPFEAVGIQDWLLPGSINFPGWSLSVEMFFYVFFPFIVVAYFEKIRQNTWIAFSLIVVYFVAVVLLNFLMGRPDSILSVYCIEHFGSFMEILPSYLAYHPLLRIGYFLSGIIAYFFISFPSVSVEHFIKKYALLLALMSIAAITWILASIGDDWQIYLRSGLLLPFYFSLFMSLAYLNDTLLKFLSNKLFVFLGAISYGIYIFQYPIHIFYENSIHSIDTYEHFAWYSVMLFVICSGIYLLYEAPLNTWIRKKFKQS